MSNSVLITLYLPSRWGVGQMMIDTRDSRSLKALVALDSAGQWLKVRDAAGQALAYGVPSATRAGLYHFATARQCTCPDSRFGHHCWHSRAVALHMIRVHSRNAR